MAIFEKRRHWTRSQHRNLIAGNSRRFLIVLGLAFVLATTLAYQAFAAAPGTPAFERTWERPDKPVESGQVSRTWMWGPEAFTETMAEDYAESPLEARLVQYYDKSRMEITNPDADSNADWYVTNGLLVVELMTGRMQVGDNSFEQRMPALVNVAGDADDPTGPTYQTFSRVDAEPAKKTGAEIIERIDRSGQITADASLAAQGATAARFVPETNHSVASPFWSFMNSAGVVYIDGGYTSADLFPNPFYATGYPVSEAYWASVKVGGTYQDVLIQAFERRVLTYTPGNAPGWQVEAGNVGQHYYAWRYDNDPGGDPTPEPTPDPSPTPDPTPDPTPEPTPQPDPELDYGYYGTIGTDSSDLNTFDKLAGIAMGPDGTLVVVDQVTERVQGYTTIGGWKFGFGGKTLIDLPVEAPQDVEVDADGNIWILDYGQSRIAGFDRFGEIIGSIGSVGSADGQLKNPVGFTIGPDGLFYVSDSGNDRVQVFSKNGTFVRGFGSSGTGKGQFIYPTGIAVHESGNVYVADQNAHEIEMFDAEGKHLLTWGTEGEGEEQFKYPSELEFDDIGNLYVADFGNGRVAVYTGDGEFNRTIGTKGTAPGQMMSPIDIAVDNEGYIYVAGRDDQYIHKFTDRGEFMDRWSGDKRSNFGQPSGVDLAADGFLYVVDREHKGIKVYTEDREFVRSWTGDHEFLADIAIYDGYAYITDATRNNVVKYTVDGTYVATWGRAGDGPGQFNKPIGIAVDSDGYVYVTEEDGIRVQKFTTDGVFVTSWGRFGTGPGEFQEPRGIDVHGDYVYVADWVGDRITVFDRDGNYLFDWGQSGTEPGMFSAAWDVAVDVDGYVYVADRDNHRIQKFTAMGELVTVLETETTFDMPEFSHPIGIAAVQQDMIYVTSDLLDAVMVFVPPAYGGQ